MGNYDLRYKLDFNKIPLDTLVKMFLDAENITKIESDEKNPINEDLLEKLIKVLDEECRKNNKKEKMVQEIIRDFCKNGLIENIESILKYKTFNN